MALHCREGTVTSSSTLIDHHFYSHTRNRCGLVRTAEKASISGSMITPRWILGFIGHRCLDDHAAARTWIHDALVTLKEETEAKGGLLELYLSCAIGADQLTIECAEELEIPVHLILPLAPKAFLKDFETEEERQTCAKLIAKAESGENGWTLRICQSTGTRPDCYYDMSQQILQGSDALFVFWNGKEARGLGGTAEMLELAKRMGLPVGWIKSQDGAFTREDWPEDWAAPDEQMQRLDEATDANSPATIEELAKQLSQMNRRHAPFFRKMITVIIMINAVAALLGSAAIISSQLHNDDRKIGPAIWLSLNFALVLTSSYIAHYLRKRRVYDRWVRGRVAAELARGIRATQPALDPLHPMVRQRAPEWARFALSASVLARQTQGREPISEFRQRYIRDRLDCQIDHFTSFGNKATETERRLTLISNAAAWAGPLCVGMVFMNKLFRYLNLSWFWQSTLLGAILIGLVPILFPLISGTAAALNSAFDARRRARRYPELADQLGTIKAEMEALRTEATILEAVQRTETTLLNELLEWRATVPHKAAKKRR